MGDNASGVVSLIARARVSATLMGSDDQWGGGKDLEHEELGEGPQMVLD